jgi:exodeoxyribonuclease VII large subunit
MARRSSEEGMDGELQLGFDMAPVLPRRKEKALETSIPEKKEIPMETPPPPTPYPISHLPTSGSKDPEVFTVRELTRRITGLLEEGLGMVWVEGEISNLRRQSSGHYYFTLKDEESQLSCVLFARSASTQKVELRDGLQVQLYGPVSVYQARGQYQLMVRLVQAKGAGVLQARFEELKRRLAAEGLFDPERKRVIPRFPRRIGVVTSPTGAAIQDFLQVLHRRHPGLRVVIHPVRVQGKGAAAEIASAISELSEGNSRIGPVDVIVVTRGGGSLEDLWEFNEEVVARAIAESSVPVVSAVGHEIDFSIADFVADLRAPTPSAAAELLAAEGSELMERCRSLVARIAREADALIGLHCAAEHRLASSALFREPYRRTEEARQTADRLEESLSNLLNRRVELMNSTLARMSAQIASAHPGHRLANARQRLSSLGGQVGVILMHRLEREKGRMGRVGATLAALSPQATLQRGFSITRTADGKVVSSASQVKPGDRILTQLANGEIGSEIKE